LPDVAASFYLVLQEKRYNEETLGNRHQLEGDCCASKRKKAVR
jgi:hypothetical protein